MKNRALLITHDKDPMDDRASTFLRSKGIDLAWCCPAEGDPVPELTDDVVGLVVYGGRHGVPDRATHTFLNDEMRLLGSALDRDVPVLGLCLGAQLLACHLGADVGPHESGLHEYGYYPLQVTAEGRNVLPEGLMVLQSHYHGFTIPRGAVRLAGTDAYANQAFSYGRNAFGFQFHPEASRTALSRWISRRGDRATAPGAFPPDRQLEDNLKYDGTLGRWFNTFLETWIAPALAKRTAA